MRVVNRLLTLVVGLVLVVTGIVAAVEVVLAGVGDRFVLLPGQTWLHALNTTEWSALPVVVAFAVILVAGLVLLIAEVRRWPESTVGITAPDGSAWRVQRKSLEARIARVVTAGVACRRVSAAMGHGRRGWHLDVSAVSSVSGQVGDEVERVARQELSGLGGPDPDRVRVKVRRSDRGS